MVSQLDIAMTCLHTIIQYLGDNIVSDGKLVLARVVVFNTDLFKLVTCILEKQTNQTVYSQNRLTPFWLLCLFHNGYHFAGSLKHPNNDIVKYFSHLLFYLLSSGIIKQALFVI